jgi:hypothetical protein
LARSIRIFPSILRLKKKGFLKNCGTFCEKNHFSGILVLPIIKMTKNTSCELLSSTFHYKEVTVDLMKKYKKYLILGRNFECNSGDLP